MANMCACGAVIESGNKFCADCGSPVMSSMACPACRALVAPANFCAECGADMQGGKTAAEPIMDNELWARGEEDFAMSVSAEMIGAAKDGAIEVRHGTKALFLEDGRLIEVAESGRYSSQEGGFLSRLFKKKKKISAVLVDAGDVELNFNVAELKTKDNLFVDVGLDIVLRLEDPNSFFVNVMKEKKAFKLHELRGMLFAEIRNALQEGVAKYDFNDLNTNLETKNILASRMEAHLRQSFAKSGLGFGQIRTISIKQQFLDETAKAAAEAEMAARSIEAGADGSQRIEKVVREARRGSLSGAKDDIDLDAAEKDVSLQRKDIMGGKEIEDQMLDAVFIEKRLEVYKKLKETDVSKIKTDEEFRKFQQEIDRDQVLDKAEWQEFESEILWKGEDLQRDRRFLVRKIELQQEYDQKRLELVNRADLQVEEKKRQLELLAVEQEGVLAQELKKIEGLARIDAVKAEARVTSEEIELLGKKETDLRLRVKELEIQKQEFEQGVGQEMDKAKMLHEISKLDLEEKKLKSELGMANLERMKLIKRQDRHETAANALEIDLERMRAQALVEKEKLEAMNNLGIEQLIAVSDANQAAVLGDLAQSQTLKGMSAEEIVAMKNPEALGKALEERAKNAHSSELKETFEQMLAMQDKATEQVSQAHKDSADRLERMSRDAFQAISGQAASQVQAEKDVTDRVERLSDKAMGNMGSVAATRARPGIETGAGLSGRLRVCGSCKQDVPVEKNFCPNCGVKSY